jgi:hypothetical protein
MKNKVALLSYGMSGKVSRTILEFHWLQLLDLGKEVRN